MRYLKTYNEIFESSIDPDTIEDIILDIKDLGFFVDINRNINYHTGNQSYKGVSIILETPSLFSFDIIKDCLLRLKSYVDSVGYEMDIDPDGKSMEFLNLEEFEDIYGGDELFMIDIIIFKRKHVNESLGFDIKDDILDILQEIKDERISVNVYDEDDGITVDMETKDPFNWFVYAPGESVYSKYRKIFNIRPAILHLNNYLNDCGYYIDGINDGFDYDGNEDNMPTFKSYEEDVAKGHPLASTMITLYIEKIKKPKQENS